MLEVPKVNQFYPTVKLDELTHLYTVGDNRFPNTPAAAGNPAISHRVCLLSYFPRALMVHDKLPFNTKYVLLLENMTRVDSITWGFQLYLNGVETAAGNFIKTFNPTEFEYDLFLMEGLLDSNNRPRFDKLKITCSVKKGGRTLKLFLYHDLARAVNAIGLVTGSQSIPFAGSPDVYNFMSNQLKEYIPEGLLDWNGHIIEISADESEALMKLVLANIYYNIQNCRSMTLDLSFVFDLNDFSAPGIKSLINDGTAYPGNFKAGLCRIPLHILNDVLPDVTALPNYAGIDAANPIFSIMVNDQFITYNNLESEVLLSVPEKLQQSRDRMAANTAKLNTLYHLATFPKPAIRIAAMLLKYLFECSKKNACKEYGKKDLRWPTSSWVTLKDYPDFAKLLFTHFYREPYNKVDVFAPEAVKMAKLAFSPYIYSLLHNISPRILRAYFANRKVTRTTTGEYWMEFERMGNDMLVNAAGNMVNEQNAELVNGQNRPIPKPAWDNFLGREFLLVVETWGFKDKNMTCRLRPSANLFTVGVNNGNLQVQADGNSVTDIQKRTGLFDALNINTNALPGTVHTSDYLRVNHAGKTIVKIRLRPQTVDDFTAWTNNLAATPLTLGITAQRSDGTACLFGSDTAQTRVSNEFLTANDKYNNISRFRIANRNFFEINHSLNFYNFLRNVNAPNENLLGKVSNDNSNNVVYFYYDRHGNEHYLGDYLITKVQSWLKGSKNLHPGWAVRTVGSETRYYKPDGINRTPLIQIQFPINYNYADIIIRLADNTDREFINTEAYASLLGALAHCGFQDVTSNGFTSADGTGAPSISHINGRNGDFRYLKKNQDGGVIFVSNEALDVARQNQLNDAFHLYGWGRASNFLSHHTSTGTLLNHCQPDNDHKNHLHIQGYQSFSVEIIQL